MMAGGSGELANDMTCETRHPGKGTGADHLLLYIMYIIGTWGRRKERAGRGLLSRVSEHDV
jgi:hypothetical protein